MTQETNPPSLLQPPPRTFPELGGGQPSTSTRNREEAVQNLRLALIREYGSVIPVVAKLARTSREDAREAFHKAAWRMLAGAARRSPGDPIVDWRLYLIQAALNALREKTRQEGRRRGKEILFSELSKDERRLLYRIATPGRTPAERAADRELEALGWAELRTLPPRQREVIERHYRQESFPEIAAALGVTIGTVKKLHDVGIRRLRLRFLAILRPQEPGDPGYELFALLRRPA